MLQVASDSAVSRRDLRRAFGPAALASLASLDAALADLTEKHTQLSDAVFILNDHRTDEIDRLQLLVATLMAPTTFRQRLRALVFGR